MVMEVDLIMKKNGDSKKRISGGGELIDKGSHLIDLARFFLGDLEIIFSKLKKYFYKMKLEDNCFFKFTKQKRLKRLFTCILHRMENKFIV